jgi:hypothetical protein
MSSTVSVKVNGTDIVLRALTVTNQRALDVVNQGLQKAAKTTYDVSQQLVAVDKGDLKDSATVDFPTPMKAVITYSTDHCWYVELGTSKMRAQPYLYPAFQYASHNFLSTMVLKLNHV